MVFMTWELEEETAIETGKASNSGSHFDWEVQESAGKQVVDGGSSYFEGTGGV